MSATLDAKDLVTLSIPASLHRRPRWLTAVEFCRRSGGSSRSGGSAAAFRLRFPAILVLAVTLAADPRLAAAGAAAASPDSAEALGAALYFDASLSWNRTQACATCLRCGQRSP